MSLILSLAGYGHAAAQSPSPATSLVDATARTLRLASQPVAFHTRDVDYLQVDGKTFQATIYQPEGPGPFPVILDVHGGAWVREDKRRDEHALMAKAPAAMGMVVDTNMSPAVQQRFAASYQAAGGRIQLELLPGAPHDFINMAGPNLDRTLDFMRTFIDQQLAGQ